MEILLATNNIVLFTTDSTTVILRSKQFIVTFTCDSVLLLEIFVTFSRNNFWTFSPIFSICVVLVSLFLIHSEVILHQPIKTVQSPSHLADRLILRDPVYVVDEELSVEMF